MTVDSSGLNLSRICEETPLKSKVMAWLQEFKPILGSAQRRLSSALLVHGDYLQCSPKNWDAVFFP